MPDSAAIFFSVGVDEMQARSEEVGRDWKRMT